MYLLRFLDSDDWNVDIISKMIKLDTKLDLFHVDNRG